MTYEGLLYQIGTIITLAPTADKDEYNAPIEGETSVKEPCLIQPLSADEDTLLRETGVASYRGFFLSKSVISMTSRLTVDGHSYEVVGQPALWNNPRTRKAHHIEALLKEVT